MARTGNWTRLNFTLTPSRATRACTTYPAGAPPLWCTCSEEECHTCVRCGGELEITLEAGGGALSPAEEAHSVDLDFVYLAPARSTGALLPAAPTVNRAPVELARRMGHRMLRYGGTFSKCLDW